MDSKMLEASFPALLLVQSCIFEVIASSTMLTGALHDLARQFNVSPDDFLDCLDELDRAGRVVVRTGPDALLSIELANWQADRHDAVRA